MTLGLLDNDLDTAPGQQNLIFPQSSYRQYLHPLNTLNIIRGRYNTIEKNEDGYKITCDRRNMVVKGIDEYMIFWYPEFRFYFTRNFIEIHIHRFFGIITPNFMIGIVHNLY